MDETKHPDASESRTARERGLALVTVLWASVILGLLAAGVAHISRNDIILTRNLMDQTRAELAADSAIAKALHEIREETSTVRPNGAVYEWQFEGVETRLSITDETGRIDLNTVSAELLERLIVLAGRDEKDAVRIADAIIEHREIMRRARSDVHFDLPFMLVDEVLNVAGMDAALFDTVEPFLTVYTSSRLPRLDAAHPLVREALLGMEASREGEETPATIGQDADDEDPPTGPRRWPSLIRIHAEARTASGSIFVREALVALPRRRASGYHRIRLWKRGTRRHF